MAKALFTQVGEVKGKNATDQITFTHQYTPSAETLKNSRGSLFGLITLYGVGADQAAKVEKDIYQTFQSAYYSSSVGSVLAALEAAFNHTNESISEKAVTHTPPKFDLVASVLWGEALYLVKTQNSGIIFQRDQSTKRLQFDKAASGAVRGGDTVCLVNQKFIEEVDINSLSQALKIDVFQGSLEKLRAIVGQKEGANALVLRVCVEEPKQERLEMIEVEGESKSSLQKLIEKVRNKISSKTPVAAGTIKASSGNILEKTKKTASLILDKILEPWRSREPGEIEDPSKRRRARAAQIAVVLIIFLTLSIGGALINRVNSARLASFNEKLNITQAKLEEIENLASVNPERAEELLAQAEQDLTEAKKFELKSEKLNELETLFGSLQESIRKIYEVSLEDFYSFEGAKINDLVQTGDSFIVLDRERSKILSVNKSSKKETELTSEDGVNLISEFEGALYLQTDQGIKKITLDNLDTTNLSGSSSEWGSLISAGIYQGNFYLLDQDKKEIWKYVPTGTGLASPQKYFKGEKGNIGKPSAMVIDGAIWIGNKDGAILRFLGGRKQGFEIDGLDKPLGEVADIFTTIESNTLFILDNTNKRVVLIDKTGRYLSQYTAEEFGVASSLVADEKNKRVYIGVGAHLEFFKYS